MSAPKMVTEREAVLRERRACARAFLIYLRASHFKNGDIEEARAFAAKEYPLPKIVRPRVVVDNSGYGTIEWRVQDGVLFWRAPGSHWRDMRVVGEHGMFVTPDRIRVLVDLLANPNEECEDDGTDSVSPVSEAGR